MTLLLKLIPDPLPRLRVLVSLPGMGGVQIREKGLGGVEMDVYDSVLGVFDLLS